MNVIAISLSTSLGELEHQSIYADLLKEFVNNGHSVSVVVPSERRLGKGTYLETKFGIDVLHVSIGNVTKCGLIEKGFSYLTVGYCFKREIARNFDPSSFDLVLFTTPPTTFYGVISWLKKQSAAKSYLLLKDIFPQNSIDLGMLRTTGIKGFIYRYFKHTEKQTYNVADYIGCMSPANERYLLMHEPYLEPNKVEVNPNSLTPVSKNAFDRAALREKFGLPADLPIYVYGGSLGKPQAIDWFVEALRLNELDGKRYFVVAGSGTDRKLLENFVNEEKPCFMKLLPYLSREDFDSLLLASDVGLVLLDYRFTIPNYPCRTLSYMQASIPYIAATDTATDVGKIAEENGFGIACTSDDPANLIRACEQIEQADTKSMGARAYDYFIKHYTANQSYKMIKERLNVD